MMCRERGGFQLAHLERLERAEADACEWVCAWEHVPTFALIFAKYHKLDS